MESANFNLQHQDHHHHQLVDSSSFSWSQNPILINGTNNDINSIVEDFRYPSNGMGYPLTTQDLQILERIKDEISVVESYPKFLELLNCNPTSCIQDLHLHPYSSAYLKNDCHQQSNSYSNNCNNNQDFLLNINDQNSFNGTFSQIFPTISISSLNKSTTTSSSTSSTSSSAISPSSFDMNCLPALDPFGSPRFNGKFSHLGGVSYGFDRMHQPSHRPSVYPSKISSVSTTGSTDQSAKRPAKETKSSATKKSKSESRSSSAPFQVRKEKLGDRIAAIQQLVAPFGKTDTASVLMEAIGYIKFLQTQVETLSVPYMKSTNHLIGGISSQPGQLEDGNTGMKTDLRSRGLCLVPVSCLSYVTDGYEGIWPAP